MELRGSAAPSCFPLGFSSHLCRFVRPRWYPSSGVRAALRSPMTEAATVWDTLSVLSSSSRTARTAAAPRNALIILNSPLPPQPLFRRLWAAGASLPSSYDPKRTLIQPHRAQPRSASVPTAARTASLTGSSRARGAPRTTPTGGTTRSTVTSARGCQTWCWGTWTRSGRTRGGITRTRCGRSFSCSHQGLWEMLSSEGGSTGRPRRTRPGRVLDRPRQERRAAVLARAVRLQRAAAIPACHRRRIERETGPDDPYAACVDVAGGEGGEGEGVDCREGERRGSAKKG